MTNKEAIEYGKKWDKAIESRGDTPFSEARQFLNLAIKALEERPQASNNAELFKQTFGIYATELWTMTNADFMEWLNADVRGEEDG